MPDGGGPWKPHPGPQTQALASSALELLFGGAAGGGKTAMLLAGAARYVDNPNFTGIVFRNTYGEALKISDQEARPLYEPLGGKFNTSDLLWKFPSGAKIHLSYLARDADVFAHQGPAYQYIAFDELTHFTLFQYRYLFSRLRSKHGITGEIRATCNPEPGWVKERFAAWVDAEYQGEHAASGERRYVLTNNDGSETFVPRGTPDALSRCFIRSMLSDNPSLSGTAYASMLKSLDPVQRARLLGGDWGADYTPGLLFRRSMFRVLPAAPHAAVRVRAWDLAATEEKLTGPGALKPGAANAPDWTVGMLYGWAPDFGFFIEHIERIRGRPEVTRAAMERIAQQDAAKYGKANVAITIPQDPGSAGKEVAAARLDMLPGYPVHIIIPTGSKVVRAGPASSTAEHMGITLIQGPWNELFLQEAEQFPKGQFDDQIDALSDGHYRIGELKALYQQARKRNLTNLVL